MARRASSNLHPRIIIGAIAAIVIAIISGKSLIGKTSTTFGDVGKLDVDELLQNGNSLRGNVYVIEGQIDEKLQWTTNRGQFVSIKVDAPGGAEFVGIEIPPKFDKFNIDTKQKYAFRVKFKEGGIPVATGINRL